MLWTKTSSLLLVFHVLLLVRPPHAAARSEGLQRFLRQARPITGQRTYWAGLRVPGAVGNVLGKLGLGRHVVRRRMVQVTNSDLKRLTRATSKGYLEVIFPANKGHVWFRHGEEVFDFYQGGFRCGGVRPIRSDRYGVLVKLTPGQEQRLVRQLERLKQSGGRELGPYDFSGREGLHCVSWFMRLGLDDAGHDLIHLLGGSWSPRPPGMVRFSRFMVKRARPVEAVLVYSDGQRTPSQLGRMKLQLISSRGIERAHRQMQRRSAAR
jgi:hypothetical protein